MLQRQGGELGGCAVSVSQRRAEVIGLARFRGHVGAGSVRGE